MKTLNIAIVCGLATLCVSTSGLTKESQLNIGGNVELDIFGTDSGGSSTFDHGGNIELDVVGMIKNDNYFIKGVAQPNLRFNPDDGDAVGVDDLYFQFGRAAWDVQLGRFEAVNLFPLGKDTLVAHAGGVHVYGANNARGRRDNVLHGALHVGSSEGLKFELGVMGNKSADEKYSAVRPAVVYKMGNMQFRAGLERTSENSVDDNGYGVSVGLNLGGGDINASLAKSDVETGHDVTSIAVNYTKGPFGAGYVHSTEKTEGTADPKVDTLYAAYTVPLLNSKEASVTFAANTSKAKNSGDDDKLNAAKVRFNYTF